MNENLLRLLLPSKSPYRTDGVSRQNSDREIILPIIILLLVDKCDFFLILALMYILI